MKTVVKIFWLILLCLTSQLWSFILGISMTPSILTGQAFNPSLIMEIIITASAVGAVYLSWHIAKTARIPLPNLKTWSKKDMFFVLGMTILTRFVAHAGLFALQYFKIEGTANDAVLNEMFANFSFPLLFVIIAFCGPIMEEWIFRAGIIGYLFEKYPLIGVVVGSLIFGAMHIPTNLISWGIYGGIGLILSLVYYKTKRLELVMAIHIFHNAVSFWL